MCNSYRRNAIWPPFSPVFTCKQWASIVYLPARSQMPCARSVPGPFPPAFPVLNTRPARRKFARAERHVFEPRLEKTGPSVPEETRGALGVNNAQSEMRVAEVDWVDWVDWDRRAPARCSCSCRGGATPALHQKAPPF